MPSFRPERRRAAPTPTGLKANDCPCVADLIDFAEGRIAPADRRRVEAHLASTNCTSCRSWITKAAGPPAAAEPTPFRAAAPQAKQRGADEAAWRQQAFGDLERRLRQLEED